MSDTSLTVKDLNAGLWRGALSRGLDIRDAWTTHAADRLREVVTSVSATLAEMGDGESVMLSPRFDGLGDVLLIVSSGGHSCAAHSVRMIAPALLMIDKQKICLHAQNAGRNVLNAVCVLVSRRLGVDA